jgi:predicted Rossmann-fold nucleotide-binding protein
LGIHTKPCVLVNTAGYYDHLLSFLQVAIDEGFLKQKNKALIQVVADAAEAVACIQKLWETLPISHVAPAKPAP